MPRVLAKEDAFAGLESVHVARFGVGDRECLLQDVEDFIRSEDGPESSECRKHPPGSIPKTIAWSSPLETKIQSSTSPAPSSPQVCRTTSENGSAVGRSNVGRGEGL